MSCATVPTWNGAPVATQNSTASSNGSVVSFASAVTLDALPCGATTCPGGPVTAETRKRAGEDDILPYWCPPYALYSRTAIRRLGPPDPSLTSASPTLWEGRHFAYVRGFAQESVFAVLPGPGKSMQLGEPCWLVACSLRDVHREMVYDRAMREVFPPHDLRRFVEIPPHFCLRNMDMEYSYAIAPYRVESDTQVAEDYARRWNAFHDKGMDYHSILMGLVVRDSPVAGL
ncbi:hypothetical protein Emag_007667 [Eimeria magna]